MRKIETVCGEPKTMGMLPGKYRRMMRISDKDGHLAILAIDQRESLRRLLKKGVSDRGLAEALRLIKRVIIAGGASMCSAVLTDPLYGYPHSEDVLPRDTGLILAIEASGYETRGIERLSRLIERKDVQTLLSQGADAVKLLIWYHPELSEPVRRHQERLVAQVGEACRVCEIPFVLEVLPYAPEGMPEEEFARKKPFWVLHGVQVFSDAAFGVDVFKLPFPAELKYVKEYQGRSFAAQREVLYDLSEVKEYYHMIDQVSPVPWAILSAGVGMEEFLENIQLATEAGASGFIAGRVVWKEMVDLYPDCAAMIEFMQSTAVDRLKRLKEVNQRAVPWYRHRRFDRI